MKNVSLQSIFIIKYSKTGYQSFSRIIYFIPSSFKNLSPNKTSLLNFNKNSHHHSSQKKPSDLIFEETTSPPFKIYFPSIKRISSSLFGVSLLVDSRFEYTSFIFLIKLSSHSSFHPTSNLHSKPSSIKSIKLIKHLIYLHSSVLILQLDLRC